MVNTSTEQLVAAGCEADNSARRALVFVIEALTVGGAEQMLVAMANRLSDSGWPVHLICLTQAGELAENLNSGIELHVLDKKPGVDLFLPARLRQLINSIEPLAVNSHLWTANTWTRLSLIAAGQRIIATEHSRDTWKSKPYRLIDRILATQMQAMVAVSSDTANFYAKEIGVPETRITVINNGIETARFREADGESVRAGLANEGEILIGTVGRMISAKNHPRLVQAIAKIRDKVPAIRLVFVGDGEQRHTLEAAIEEHGITDITTLTGTRHDIPQIVKALDIFVLSSDREGHPLTALEAQAAGTPVVLTDAGGSADAIVCLPDTLPVINQSPLNPVTSSGLLVDKTVDSLARGLLTLALNQSLRQEMGALGMRLCESNFDQNVMVEKYLHLFSG